MTTFSDGNMSRPGTRNGWMPPFGLLPLGRWVPMYQNVPQSICRVELNDQNRLHPSYAPKRPAR